MSSKILLEDVATVALRGAVRWPVVVGEVKVGNAAIKGTVHDPATFIEVITITKVMPEPQRDSGQLEAPLTTLVIGHGVIAGW